MVLRPLLSHYRDDRLALPLWTYQSDAWETHSVPWFVRVMWSPRVRARPLVGQASGFYRYLENTEVDNTPVKWIEAFGPWPEVMVRCAPRATTRVDRSGSRSAVPFRADYNDVEVFEDAPTRMPQLLQAHVAGLYAVTGDRVPDEDQEIALPERPDGPDVEAFLADARRTLERLYQELEAVVTGDPDLLERVRQDFGRRIAQGEWWRNRLGEARKLSDSDERNPEAEYHLREELGQGELVSELLDRMEAWPSLQGDRKIPVDEDALLKLYREALELVDRFRNWAPDSGRIVDLIDLVIEDPVWQVTDSAIRDLRLWKARLQRPSSPERREDDEDSDAPPAVATMPKGEVPVALLRYARWLRFPYLPSPVPGPLAAPDGRTRKRAARWLLRQTLPGGPIADSTLQSYLTQARKPET